jgi:catechol 2,3-dioxygenase-like lactoylglutathione lyase family enzyme
MIDTTSFGIACGLILIAGTAVFGQEHGQSPAAGKIVGQNAIIHTVANLDKSVAFYRDAVGLKIDGAAAFPSGATHEIQSLTNAKGARVKATALRIPGTDLRLVLAQFSNVEQKPVESRLQDPGGVKLVLRVRDIDKAFEDVERKIMRVYTTGGKPIHPQDPQGPARRSQAVIVKDPDGFPLEFVLPFQDIPGNSRIIDGWATLVVEDIDRTLEFYGEQLGFKVNAKRQVTPGVLALEGTDSASVVNASGSPPGSSIAWFMFDFRHIDRRVLRSRIQDPGNSAISLFAEDLTALVESLKAKGVPVETAGGEPVNLDQNTRGVFVRDPSGILIELVEGTP